MFRVSRTLLFTEVFIGLILAAYFSSYLIFPEVPGSDFGVHVGLSRDIAHGVFPSLSSALLYDGVEFFLAIPQFLFPHANPFIVVRLSMALLVLISPLVVYLCVKEIFEDSFKAKMSALTYALTGWIWADWVLVTSLFANFYGFLASLLLVAAVMRFEHKKGMVSWALLGFALVNALLSHYTTLLVFPPLIFYALYRKQWGAASVLVAPLAVGPVLFPSMVGSLLNFLAPTTVIGPGSSSLPPFSLSALDSVLTDYEFGFLMLGAIVFGYLAFKKRDSKMLFLLAWFVLPLAVAPLNSSAWRFAFMSLVPGTLMLGYVLASIPKFPLSTRKGLNQKNFLRTLLLVGLLLSPTFYPSWGFLALSHSFQSDPQQGVYDSLVWMGHHLSPNYTAPDGNGGSYAVCVQSPQDPHCPHLVSVDDWRLTYSPLFKGPDVLYAPDYGVLWEDPLQMQLFALNHNSDYIAVSRVSTFPVPSCDPRYSFGLTLSADTTTAKPNQTVTLTVGAIKGLNATANLFDDGTSVAQVRLQDGKATVEALFPHNGDHSLVLAIGSTATSPLTLSIGPYASSVPSTVSVPLDFCQPWFLYSQASMSGWSAVYQSDSVVMWKYGK